MSLALIRAMSLALICSPITVKKLELKKSSGKLRPITSEGKFLVNLYSDAKATE